MVWSGVKRWRKIKCCIRGYGHRVEGEGEVEVAASL